MPISAQEFFTAEVKEKTTPSGTKRTDTGRIKRVKELPLVECTDCEYAGESSAGHALFICEKQVYSTEELVFADPKTRLAYFTVNTYYKKFGVDSGVCYVCKGHFDNFFDYLEATRKPKTELSGPPLMRIKQKEKQFEWLKDEEEKPKIQ